MKVLKTSSIFGCIYPIFYISKICGFAPYGLSKTGSTQTSYFDYFVTILAVCAHLFIFKATLCNFLDVDKNLILNSKILNIGSHILKMSVLSFSCVSLFVSHFTKMENRNIFDMLDNCDKQVII